MPSPGFLPMGFSDDDRLITNFLSNGRMPVPGSIVNLLKTAARDFKLSDERKEMLFKVASGLFQSVNMVSDKPRLRNENAKSDLVFIN